jgi:hypothetical protein
MAKASTIEYLLLGESPRLRWFDGTVYTNVASFQAAVGKGRDTIVGFPQFVNAAAGNFRLAAGSPGVDAGVVNGIYDLFQSRYGLDIRTGADGVPRAPVGRVSDRGAYQLPNAGGLLAQPTAPQNVRVRE